MQTDMHFFSVYYLARSAGFYPWAARLIAYSSQHVDYAGCDGLIRAGDYLVEKVMTSHRPLDAKLEWTQKEITPWPVFHFLPGGQREEKSTDPYDRMRCQKKSIFKQLITENVMAHVEKNFYLHLAGIALHGFYDSFSHWGFIGVSHKSNRIKNGALEINRGHISESVETKIWDALKSFREKIQGTVAETIPVGHCAIGTLADQPFLRIEYQTEDGLKIVRDNPADFLKAAETGFQFLARVLADNHEYGNPEEGKTWEDIKEEIKKLISREGSLNERINNWRKLIKSEQHFKIKPGDGRIWYAPEAWGYKQLEKHLKDGGDKKFCNPLLFTIAARIHRDFLIGKMRDFNLILG
jgi:hypothetical protein